MASSIITALTADDRASAEVVRGAGLCWYQTGARPVDTGRVNAHMERTLGWPSRRSREPMMPTTKITEAVRTVALRRPLKPVVIRDGEIAGLCLIVTAKRSFWALVYQPRGINPATGKRWGGGTRHEICDAMLMPVSGGEKRPLWRSSRRFGRADRPTTKPWPHAPTWTLHAPSSQLLPPKRSMTTPRLSRGALRHRNGRASRPFTTPARPSD